MDIEEIRQRVASLPDWHYEFDLQGVKTPLAYYAASDREAHNNRLRNRVAYFFEPLVDLCGGTLRGKRVLDLGCNAGFWALEAVKAGADFVYGVDGRQALIDQANLVFEASSIEPSRYEFAVGDVLTEDFTALGMFDIVLCLGLVYHVAKPMELFENISKVSSDILLIDTGVSTMSGSIIELRRDDLENPRSAIDYELVMFPTRRAVVDMVGQFGYRVVTLQPHITDYRGMLDYMSGARLAFVAAKATDLSQLPVLRKTRRFALSGRIGQAWRDAREAAAASAQLVRPAKSSRRQIAGELLADYRRRGRRLLRLR